MTQFNMIEAPQGPDPKRLLLAVVVTSAVLMLYSYFFAPDNKVNENIVAKKEDAPVLEIKPEPKEELLHPLASKSDLPLLYKDFSVLEALDDKSPERTSYRAQLSSQGGLISEFVLTAFSEEKKLWDHNTGSSLLRLKSHNNFVSLSPDVIYEIVSAEDATKADIVFRHVSPEGLRIERSYKFLDHAIIKESINFKNLGDKALKAELSLSAHKVGQKNAEPGLMNPGVQAENLAIKTPTSYEHLSYSDLVNKTKIFSDTKYVAFDDQFFISALITEENSNIEKVEVGVLERDNKNQEAYINLFLKPFILVPGEEKDIDHRFFMGPKQVDLLSALNPPLDENIDFGWFGVLSRPMLWLLVQIYNFVHNYGLAIILITFIIKLLTYPLTQKSFKSQQAMKELQPKIKAIQAKYSHDRTLQGQKQMELYRTEGINPLAGCLPMLIQLPIWFAFFQMLRSSVELYDQPFYGWITDLTRPDQFYILPILMGGSMLIQQLLTPTPADQPQMKYLMWAMPIFLTFIMLNMPSGLSLYILTNNLLTILQQIIIKRHVVKS
jgi:YidC/Oxa1 family membrane protein insertase